MQYGNLKHCFWLLSSMAGALQMLLMLTASLDYLTFLVALWYNRGTVGQWSCTL